MLNGKQSETIPVTSGVPQGTALGPLLFLVFINELPDKVRSSTARLFADDCLLYHNVQIPQDVDSLQEDLNALQAWEKDWQMAFNPSKCQPIHFTRKRNPMILDYTIRDQVLETDESATYLGVKLHATASWSPHCSTASKKAECTRAFLQRNLARTPQPIKKQCYTTLLRPILEYTSAVWDPHCQSDIQKLERTQRRYARFTCGDYSQESSVTEMLQTLGWDTLAERRAKSRAVMTYCIRYDLVDIPLDQHFTQLTTRNRGNSEKFRVPYSRTLSAKHSFFPDATRIWNNIPDDATRAESLDTFKSRLAGLTIRT